MAIINLGGNAFTAYADVAFADVWLSADVQRAAPWALLQPDAKSRAMITAARVMAALSWCGTPPDPAAAPAVVMQVNAMLAADIAAKPKLAGDATGNSNVKVAKAGSAQVEFFRAVEGGAPLPPALWGPLLAAGLVGCAGDVPADAPFVSGAGYPSRFGPHWYEDERVRPFYAWEC